MKSDQKTAIETWLVLQQLKEDLMLTLNDEVHSSHIVEKPKVANYPSVESQIRILIELQKLGAIKVHRRDFSGKGGSAAVHLEDLHIQPNGSRSKGVWFEKLPKFDDVYKEYSQYAGKTINTPVSKYWITKEDGKYFFDGKLTHFKSKRGKYLKIFDAVFHLMPEGGSVSYKEIREQCGATQSEVLRALSGKSANLFIQAPSISFMSARGIPLFEPDRKNERFTFNNEK